MAQTTKSVSSGKPEKPYPDFPLFPHATRRWAKKIRGKLHYFGKWDDPQAALDKYLAEKDYLHAGKLPPENLDGTTVRHLCNTFLTFKQERVDSGELTLRSFADYKRSCDTIVATFGKGRLVDDLRPSDFETLRGKLAKVRGPVSLGNEIVRIRVVFNFAFEHSLVDRPLRYGAGFKKPSQRSVRKSQSSQGLRMFESAELRKLISEAPQPLKAMILVAANSGMGNHDIGSLPLSAVDLDSGWVDFPREKTGSPRRFHLWPETLASIAEVIGRRKPKPSAEHLLFVTRRGHSWAKDTNANPISREFRKLLDATELYRTGLGFYCLRRTFQTIGEEAGETATKHIMGHVAAVSDMSAIYRQRISDERLRAVTDHVRTWLFGGEVAK